MNVNPSRRSIFVIFGAIGIVVFVSLAVWNYAQQEPEVSAEPAAHGAPAGAPGAEPDVSADMLIRLSSVDTRCSVLECRCRTPSFSPDSSGHPSRLPNLRRVFALRPIAKRSSSGCATQTALSAQAVAVRAAGRFAAVA